MADQTVADKAPETVDVDITPDMEEELNSMGKGSEE